MDLELLIPELEALGTIVELDERNEKLYIALSNVDCSTLLTIDLINLYYDFIYDDYKGQETLCVDGDKVKIVYSNDEEYITDDGDYINGITNS